MPEDRILHFHLQSRELRHARAGRHKLINQISEVVRESGFEVAFCRDSDVEYLRASERPGYSMFHMNEPANERSLTFRRVYENPFWAIERSSRRWEWPVAQLPFPADAVPRRRADSFYRYWRNRLFGTAAERPTREGICYVPLQGRLLAHRSFQSCSPLEMVEAVLEHDHTRQIVATLHPNERYTEAEQEALAALARAHPRLTIATGGMADLLARCDYVVTQNSSVAFLGYFFAKPAVLFGQIDFHHIAAKVHDLGVAEALRQGPALTPDYAGYLHWFWFENAINAGREEAPARIRARLQAAGWPV